MKTNRRGFFQAFAAAAAGMLVPRAATAPKVAETAAAVGRAVTINLDGRQLAELMIRELPHVARMQGLR